MDENKQVLANLIYTMEQARARPSTHDSFKVESSSSRRYIAWVRISEGAWRSLWQTMKVAGRGTKTGRLDPGAVFESPRCHSKVLLQQLLNFLPVPQISRSGYFWNCKSMFEKMTSMGCKPAGAQAIDRRPDLEQGTITPGTGRMWNLLLLRQLMGKKKWR